MPAVAAPLAILAAELILLYAVSSGLNRVAFRVLGRRGYLLLMFPGVVVHELSHFLACVATGTRVVRVRFFAPRDEGGTLVLGEVVHEKPRLPFASALIGGAPFFGGSAALAALTAGIAPAAFAAFAASRDPASFRAIAGFARATATVVDLGSWKTYAAAYVAVSVAAHVAPSRTDLRGAAFSAAAAVGLLLLASAVAARYAHWASMPLYDAVAAVTGTVAVALGAGLACTIPAFAIFSILSAVLRK